MELLNEYSALIQALASAASIATFAACVSAFAACVLVRETCRLREDAKRPQMSAKLKPMAEHGDFIQLVLHNTGRGAALNVRVRVDGDEEDFARHEMTPVRGASVPINFMSQGESEIYELGPGRTLFADPPMKPFSVVINYEDVDGQSYEKRIVLDVKQFDGLAWSGASVAWRQMEALEGIAKHFKSN